MKSVLVIGAGIGGLAVAGRLAKGGYQVTVLEKNDAPGGRCNQIVREGHRFDVGPSLFLMPDVFRETYAALGERMEDHVRACTHPGTGLPPVLIGARLAQDRVLAEQPRA
jgi:phytoene dehydrogenase-like protein